MKTFALAAALAAGLLCASPGTAKDLKLASIGTATSAWGQMITGFADRVAELSGGTLTVTPYWTGQLGNQQDTLNMMLRGRLDIWSGPSSSLGILSEESNVYGLPYMFRDQDQALCVIEKTAPDLGRIIEARGHFLALYPNAWVNLASKSALHTPEDVQGMKVRTGAQEVATSFWNAVGAQAVPMPVGELNQALATNLVHAGETVTQFYAAIKTNNVAPFYVETHHYFGTGAYVMSSRAWKGLTEQEQAIITQAVDETLDFADATALLDGVTAKSRDELKAEGVTFVTLTDDEMALWRAKGEAARAALVAGLSESSQAFYQTVLDAIESCGE